MTILLERLLPGRGVLNEVSHWADGGDLQLLVVEQPFTGPGKLNE